MSDPVIIRLFHPLTATVGDREIQFRVKRLDVDQLEAYEGAFRRFQTTPSNADAPTRETFDRERVAFARQSIEQYISVERGQLAEEIERDGEVETIPVVTGADVYRLYGMDAALLMVFLMAIYVENQVNEDVKKNWRSRLILATGSDAVRQTAVDGKKPASVARRVNGSGTAVSATAMGSSGTSSGTTGHSSRSGRARSSPSPQR